MKRRVLTGIKPTNKLHIGNYIGCIRQIQELSKEDFEIFLFVPDLHALTDDNNLKESIFTVMRVFLATCTGNITYYIQSEHLEIPYIAWILSCCTPIGHLQRMTQFKSKESESLNSGYLFYPVLMAADIISIDADLVPVGIDQKQHIELTRDICDYFKKKYQNKDDKEIFVKPKPKISESIKILSLQDCSKKMSKSDENSLATIFLNDKEEEITKKIKKAVTDSENMPENIKEIEDSRKAVYNLCVIYKEISGLSFEYIEKTFGNQYISVFKDDLIKKTVEFLIPLQEKINSISDNYINEILNRDREKVHKILSKKVSEINGILK